MDQLEFQRDVRSAISIAYELARHEHVQQHEPVARALRELEAELLLIERKLGGKRIQDIFPSVLTFALGELEGFIEDGGPVVGEQIKALMKSVERIAKELVASRGIPSRPLLGVLPIRRVVPQDVHSIMDYASSLTAGAGALVAETPEAQIASAVLAASGIGVSACTDYRLSAAKLIPIEAHEVIDYVWGAAAIAAPFALGYSKKDPVAAALHIFAGASTILSSLFTDYRSAVGVGHTPKLKED